MLDVPTDIPAYQLKEIRIRWYKTEVMIDSDKAKSIELTTRKHSYDDDAAVVWFSKRRKRTTSSNADQ